MITLLSDLNRSRLLVGLVLLMLVSAACSPAPTTQLTAEVVPTPPAATVTIPNAATLPATAAPTIMPFTPLPPFVIEGEMVLLVRRDMAGRLDVANDGGGIIGYITVDQVGVGILATGTFQRQTVFSDDGEVCAVALGAPLSSVIVAVLELHCEQANWNSDRVVNFDTLIQQGYTAVSFR